METALIALGGNLGNVSATMHMAVERLTECRKVSVLKISSEYESCPVGENAGDHFTNSAVLVETAYSAERLLRELHSIEDMAGRVRKIHWGPRTLDLDLILYGNEVIDRPDLRVPHPSCWFRRFVLDPAVEIAPELVHPVWNMTLTELRDRLLRRPFRAYIQDREGQLRIAVERSEKVELTDTLSSASLIIANDDSPITGFPVLRVPSDCMESEAIVYGAIESALRL